MFTKYHTFIPCHLQGIKFKVDEKVFFPCANGGQQSFGVQKTTFSSRHGWCIILFLFLSELGIYLQNLIPTRGVEY
jgi:hypothetical protein